MRRFLEILTLLALAPLLVGLVWTAAGGAEAGWRFSLPSWEGAAHEAAGVAPENDEAPGIFAIPPEIAGIIERASQLPDARGRRLLERAAAEQPSPWRPLLVLAAAMRARDAEQWDEVRRLATDEALAGSHLAPRGTLLRAEALAATGELERAQSLLDLAQEEGWGERGLAELRRRRVDVLLELEDGEAALEEVERLEPLAPHAISEPEILFLRARAYEAMGRRDRAHETLDALYFHHPASSWNASASRLSWRAARAESLRRAEVPLQDRLARADAFYRNRWFTSALREYETILAQFPHRGDPDLMRLRAGVSALERRKAATALEHLRHVGSTRRDLFVEALYHRGLAERRLRRTDAFLASMQRAANMDATGEWRSKAQLAIGDWFRERDAARARDAYRQAADAAPHTASASEGLWRLGWSLYHDYDFEAARETFLRLAASGHHPHERAAGVYWAAKAEAGRGRPGAEADLLRRVAREFPNDYYGMRALESLGLPVEQRPVSMEPEVGPDHWIEELRELERRGPASPRLRAKLLLVRDLAALADWEGVELEIAELEEEWGETPELAGLRLDVYGARGDHLAALRTFRRIYPDFRSRLDIPEAHWRAVYPRRFLELIRRNARHNGLDPDFVLAVVHQESVFDPRATSHVGARGLMQIMPATGRDLSRRIGESGYRTARLYDVDTNVRFGTFYLADLLDRFDGRPELALAGYNAGSGRVDRWTMDRRTADPDVFVESIPFDETRNYVQRVLESEIVYRALMSDEQVAEAPDASGQQTGEESQ